MNRLLVAGIGSHQADDATGWQVVELLQRLYVQTQQTNVNVFFKNYLIPLDLLHDCGHYDRVVVCDTIRPTARGASYYWLDYPDDITERTSGLFHSVHGFGVIESLQLANSLGRLPANVHILGLNCAENSRDYVPELFATLLQRCTVKEEA